MIETYRNAWKRQRRLALLIGINDYEGGELHQLRACVNDVEAMEIVARERFDFAVVSLKNQQATRKSILEAMGTLLEVAKRGDQILFYWSGHGSRLQLSNGRTSETLVPIDSRRSVGWPGNQDIIDREVFGWICRISEKTSFLTLIIDACRSGGIVSTPGAVSPTGAIAQSKTAFPPVVIARSSSTGRASLPLSDRYVLLASSSATGYSYDLTDPSSGFRRGVFSYCLQTALQDLKAPLTWREAFAEIEVAIRRLEPRQTPQLEGCLDREVFGRRISRPHFFLPVVARDEQRILLGAGSVHGIAPGSRWSLASGFCRRPKGNQLGEVLIQSVGAALSEGLLIEESEQGAVQAGCRAFALRPKSRAKATLARFFPNLEHPEPTTSAAATVDLKVFRLSQQGNYEEALPESPTLAPRTRVAFELSHQHPEPLQVTLLRKEASGAVTLLYPAIGRYEPWIPEKVLAIGLDDWESIELGQAETDSGTLIFLFTEAPIRNLDLLLHGSRIGNDSIQKRTAARPSQLRTENPGPESPIGQGKGVPIVDVLSSQREWGIVHWHFYLGPELLSGNCLPPKANLD